MSFSLICVANVRREAKNFILSFCSLKTLYRNFFSTKKKSLNHLKRMLTKCSPKSEQKKILRKLFFVIIKSSEMYADPSMNEIQTKLFFFIFREGSFKFHYISYFVVFQINWKSVNTITLRFTLPSFPFVSFQTISWVS